MLTRLKNYFNTKKHLINLLLHRTLQTSADGLCCITIAPQEFTLVHARQVSGRTSIRLCETHAYKDNNSLLTNLINLVKHHQLKNVPCILLLQPEDYQVLITDTLPVTKEEFQDAIRWKIKDTLRFSLDDVVIDSFPLPKLKSNQQKIMVIAARSSKLKSMSEQIIAAGLSVWSIEIPELSLRNIANLYEEENETVVFTYIQENNINIIITSQQQVYVLRQLKFTFDITDETTAMQGMERLTAELQRSLDYYQSLWSLTTTFRFIISSVKVIPENVISTLAKTLNAPVIVVDLSHKLTLLTKLTPTEQAKILPVIGAVIREKVNNEQQINLYRFLPQKTGYELEPRIILSSYLAFLGLLVLINLIMLWQRHSLTKEYEAMLAKHALQQQELNEVLQQYPDIDITSINKSILDLQTQYDQKIFSLNVVSPYAHFSNYLLALANNTVDGVWLTQITLDRGDTKVALRGFTLQPQLLEQFYRELSKEPLFSNLTFEINQIEQKKFPTSFYITGKKVHHL